MPGTREEWAKLLPLIQAFVAGEPIQHLQYGGRWSDSETLYGLLTGSQFRITPAESRLGVWRRPFRVIAVGSVDGPVGAGVMEWHGADTDTPNWPSGHGMTYTGDAEFTPNDSLSRQGGADDA